MEQHLTWPDAVAIGIGAISFAAFLIVLIWRNS